jgi:hypothetical protein
VDHDQTAFQRIWFRTSETNRTGNNRAVLSFCFDRKQIGAEDIMKGGLLWLIGIPLPIIIALYLFGVL